MLRSGPPARVEASSVALDQVTVGADREDGIMVSAALMDEDGMVVNG